MVKFLQFTLIRAVMSVVTLLIVSLVVFSLMELVPGNCAERYIAFKNTQGQVITIEDIQAEERRLGLDKPFMIRAGTWAGNVFFKGEFGDSCILRLNINHLLSDKVWISLGICLAALFLSYLIAIPIGIYSATTRNPVANNSVRFISYLGLALPSFLLALMIMLTTTVLFGESMAGLFSKEYRDAAWSVAKFMNFMSRAWLPIFILGWAATAFALQTIRALMLDEIGKLYVTAATARGISGRTLLWRYPARHSLGPVINSLGFDLNRIFNDLPVVALIMTLTEMGALLIDALAFSNDQQLAGAILVILTACIVLVNFITDIILALMDPRVRLGLIG
ncbi:MAG: ABC transporter permease [Arenicellales bacterium]|jgi:peptide/nickel transport system permease protein|nr:ABC transporter permease [Arenicellales bacterium]|tara:strand:+ start:118 stop:1125 length:1008 start_codon:yes stop_codon:yes gene_type:complete